MGTSALENNYSGSNITATGSNALFYNDDSRSGSSGPVRPTPAGHAAGFTDTILPFTPLSNFWYPNRATGILILSVVSVTILHPQFAVIMNL
jgi:hypothetical protein